ncbi:MAG TPA: nucleotidyltransferase domain-containing protein [Bacteroidia bacterium]|nr:nucleotidyltransferase domain-containing protein [Bacteroidia bacterium]
MLTKDSPIIQLSPELHAVYSCLCYFDVFEYPLKTDEVLRFSGLPIDAAQVPFALEALMNKNLIQQKGPYYFLRGRDASCINKRQAAENLFAKKRGTIRNFARFVARFPFVESVAISGSCSKGLLEKDGDVDYFVITAPGRLWLCRSLLIAFKKIFLLNSKKYFCVNYLISGDHLEIPDHNAFVACEISTLLPVSNPVLFQRFLHANSWVKTFLPNSNGTDTRFLFRRKPLKWISGLIELFCRGQFGDFLDRQFFKLTLSTWERKFEDFSREDFDLNLRSRKNVSKHHPRGFQNKVLRELKHRLSVVNSSSAE